MPPLNLDQITDQRTRGYLYRVLAAAGVVALSYGVLSAEEVAVWTGLVATIFAVPAYNTPTKVGAPASSKPALYIGFTDVYDDPDL